jgi:hypothetical protein
VSDEASPRDPGLDRISAGAERAMRQAVQAGRDEEAVLAVLRATAGPLERARADRLQREREEANGNQPAAADAPEEPLPEPDPLNAEAPEAEPGFPKEGSTFPKEGWLKTTEERQRSSETVLDPSSGKRILDKAALLEYDRREEVARAVAAHIGLEFAKDTTWRVGGADLVVRPWCGKDGEWKVAVHTGWPTRPVRRSLTLAEAFAIHATGELREKKLGRPEHARFKLRMLVDVGVEEAAEVRLAPLPEGAPLDAVETWALVGRLESIRRLGEPPEEPFAFSAPWVARFFAVDQKLVERGKYWLEKHGYLTRAGESESRWGKATVLWVALELDLVQVLLGGATGAVQTMFDHPAERRGYRDGGES